MCPARSGLCHKCGRPGHFANKCRSAASRFRDSEPRQTQNERERQPRDDREQQPRARPPRRRRARVRAVASDDSADSDRDVTFRLTARSTVRQLSGCEENKIPVRIGGIASKLLIDSGSSVSALDHPTWVELRRRNLRFEEAEIKKAVYRYGDSSVPLRIIKAIEVPVNSKRKQVMVKFYVLDRSEGPCGSVLGSKVAKRLGLLRVGEVETEVIRQLAVSPPKACPLGKLNNFQLDIPIDDSIPPVAQPCRRVPFAFRKPISRHLKELRAADIIEPVTGATPWVSPVVPVVKKNGDMRLCVDMRRANEAVLRENFPIPTFDELVAEMRDCEYFSRLDLQSAYHQIELTPRSRAITTFTTPDGIFRFKRLFFGIKCAPEMFQRIMQSLLQGIPNVRVFFDDIIVFSKTLADYKKHIAQVIDTLVRNGLVLNREKSVFGVKQITFLGHRLAKNEIRPTEDNTETIRKFSIPASKAELQSFLGLTNYVSRFIPNYSVLTEPLRELLRKGESFKWLDRRIRQRLSRSRTASQV